MIEHFAEKAAALFKSVDLIGETLGLRLVVPEIRTVHCPDGLFQFGIAGIVGNDHLELFGVLLLRVDAVNQGKHRIGASVGRDAERQKQAIVIHG